jgi:hypothetical protein
MPSFTQAVLACAFLSLALAAGPPTGRAAEHEGHDDAIYAPCAKACADCARECDSCATHCATMIAEGHKPHLTTLRTCQDCATTCYAAAAIVSRKGPFSRTICEACADACQRCGKACEQFPDDPKMKKCAEECRRCEKACRDMLQHLPQKAA